MFGREMRNFNTRVETEAGEQQGQVGTSSRRQRARADRGGVAEGVGEQAALQQRIEELRRMFEQSTEVVRQIAGVQEKQREQQDGRHRVLQPLKPGTVVFKELPALVRRGAKLTPRRMGPFVVVRQARNGNYVLATGDGKTELPRNTPREKLFVAPETVQDDGDYEVERVEDIRNKDGETQYLVKWKGYSALENSWVAETDFNEIAFGEINTRNCKQGPTG